MKASGTTAKQTENNGIQNPVLRLLYSLVTEHIMAKIFAVLFAGIVVYLVSRELMDTWIDAEALQVVTFSEAQQSSATRHRVVLKPEADVAIDTSGLGALKMIIKGPEKHTAEFNRRLDIRVSVKRDWAVNAEGWATHTLTADDLDVGVPGAEIVLLDPPESRIIRVNLFETIDDVEVVLQVPAGALLPVGWTWSAERTKILPARVQVIRPRNPGADSGQVVVALEQRSRYEDGASVRALLLKAQRDNHIRIKPQTVDVRIALEGQDATFKKVITGIPIQILMTPANVGLINGEEYIFDKKMASMKCAVTLAVPYSMPEGERTDEALAKGIIAFMDISSWFEKVADDATDSYPRADVQVVGLPASVELVSVKPRSYGFGLTKVK